MRQLVAAQAQLRVSEPWLPKLREALSDATPVTRQRRRSLALVETPDTLTWAMAGQHFRFVNREEQCAELLSAFLKMERLRLNASPVAPEERWETFKRDVRVPVCTGMPGIGKTRFAREAASHLGEVAPAASGGTAQTADALLTAALVHAGLSDRNLRIDCSSLDRSTDEGFAVMLLAEWAKHRGTCTAARVRAALLDTYVSLRDAVLHVLYGAPEAAGGASGGAGSSSPTLPEDPPALLINIDEAHVLPAGLLGSVLRQLLRMLIVDGYRVFVTVTGVNADRIRAELDSTHVGVVDISLPLLTLDHICEVSKAFMPELDENRLVFVNTLWWLGGVPRFLAHLLEQAAEMIKPGQTNLVRRSEVAAFLNTIDATRGSSLISFVAKRVLSNRGLEAQVLDGALSFALVGQRVPRTHILSGTIVDGYTVQRAQADSLLYWRPTVLPSAATADGLGVIEVPPIVLYWRHLSLPADQQVYLLQSFAPFMSSRDNEGVAVSVIMHKLHAMSQMGRRTVRLSELGLPLISCDREVQLPTRFEVVRTSGNVESHNFLDVVTSVRRDPSMPVAYVNAPTAKFADAFIILPDFIIFFQEKQCVKSRLQAAAGMTVPTAKGSELDVEYVKVVRTLPHTFLYITDERAAVLEVGAPDASRCFVSHLQHKALLGSMFAHLRAAVLAPSFVDARSDAAVAAGSGRAQ